MAEPVSVVIPARNEAQTIGSVIERLSGLGWVDEIVVVDNASTDGTAEAAAVAGARSIHEPEPGMGHAVRAGLRVARNDWVMKVDADLEGFDTARFSGLVQARAPGIGLIKGAWNDPGDDMPMTRLLVLPAIRLLFPGLAHLSAPNSGIYLVNRSLIAHQEIVGGYAADLDVMLRVHAAGAGVAEIDIGEIEHDPRDLSHYNAMAENIMALFLSRQEKRITEEMVVVAESAEQVIRNCLGVLADRSRSGGVVTVFLQKAGGDAADRLRAVLAPFPTARLRPMKDAMSFTTLRPNGRLRLIAPYPHESGGDALRTALRLRSQMPEDTELLLMPDKGKAFRADVTIEVGEGALVRQSALEQRGLKAGGSREVFQSFASLPGPLRRMLVSDGKSEAERG